MEKIGEGTYGVGEYEGSHHYFHNHVVYSVVFNQANSFDSTTIIIITR